MAYKSVNPYNGKVLKTFDDITDEQLEATVARAAKTFEESWSLKAISYRGSILKRAAAILRERLDEFARPITLEMGKLWAESQDEVRLSADILEYYANQGPEFLAPKTLIVQEGEAVVESEPIGIIFGVEPWNFPYYQLARVVGPSFILGNVVMVKHASNVPQCAEAFEKLFQLAGAPAGVYTNLFATKDQIARLISDPRVKAVAMTGSEGAGSVVASQAGKSLKKSTMELGGSDAFIVLEDADLDRAVSWAVWGRMNNTGQCCVASKRFIVVDKVADEFLKRFKASLQLLKPGDPMIPETTLGPLSSEGALRDLLKQVEGAVSNGAKLILGGKRLDRPGAFIEAGILTDIKPSNPAYYQEFFGPVALFFRVKDESEAIALANDSPFGLGGSVFTEDVERGKQVARRIHTGMVFINQATWTAPELPFGGIKNSGYGKELSELGLQEFVNKKLIRVSEALPAPEFPVA
ncbi:MAG TPA: NAD-dependent succinate-semialdehyde dehydrogenase [Chthoniobacterales bacterium]|nr:NAD-dependent succinate-semialdehyde dehydrogenase [Chthoniobacterales bacterium]